MFSRSTGNGFVVLLAIMMIAGCTSRGGGRPQDDSGSAERGDAGMSAIDATTSTSDASGSSIDANRSGDASRSVDSSTPATDAPHVDAALDAADARAGADAGPPADSGPSAAGVTCVSAIDVSAPGTYMGDTCTGTDIIRLSCGSHDAPELYYFVGPTGSSSYYAEASAGFSIGLVSTASCSAVSAVCPLGSFSTPGAPTYFAVESTSGTCGTFTLTVTHSGG